MFLMASFTAKPQDGKPAPPDVTYVSVDLENNNIKIKWEHSTSPDVVKYYIYKDGTQLNDTVYYPADSLIYNGTYNQYQVFYVVAVDTSNFHSVGGEYHNTMRLNVDYDSCSAKMTIRWNAYKGWDADLKEYHIYDYTNNSLLGSAKDTVFVHSNVKSKHRYDYYVKAINKNGVEANSYKVEKYTSMPISPGYIDLSASTSGNNILLKYFIDPASEIKEFRLLRSISYDSDYEIIKTFANGIENNGTYLDTTANLTETIYYYRLEAVNTCAVVTCQSNIASNILLNVESGTKDLVNSLDWSKPKGEGIEAENYFVYLVKGDTALLIAQTASDQYEHDIAGLVHDSLNSNFCYFIRAGYNHTLSGKNVEVLSNKKCIVRIPECNVPNAFTPLNSDGVNDVFRPFLSFLPKSYYFAVYNRWGNKVFETKNPLEGWDGKINGKYAREGVYVYFVSYKNYDDFVYNKKGHVTIINQYNNAR